MLNTIQNTLIKKGYIIFTRPYQLNIIGIRSSGTVANSFNDSINLFYKIPDGTVQFHSFKATTDPGMFWLNNPINQIGTAILKPGQYKQSHKIGLHRGKYLALVQQNPVTVIRDGNRNAILDFTAAKEQTGLFGINIHHAAATGLTKTVDKYSAGCQVLANINDFNLLMQLAKQHAGLYGNSFTYTLINQSGLVK